MASELQVQDWIPHKQQCPAAKGYYCVFCAFLFCFIHLATKQLFHFILLWSDFISSSHVNDFNNLLQCGKELLFWLAFIMITPDDNIQVCSCWILFQWFKLPLSLRNQYIVFLRSYNQWQKCSRLTHPSERCVYFKEADCITSQSHATSTDLWYNYYEKQRYSNTWRGCDSLFPLEIKIHFTEPFLIGLTLW